MLYEVITPVRRLVEMGVAPFLAASAIIGILAQRLVRRLCPDCREAFTADAVLLEELGLAGQVEPGALFYRPRGCDACQQLGYRGRTGVITSYSIHYTKLYEDPDIIMVGEIRDSETAEIAVQAALTGHLVFSTLHTNDSYNFV